MRHALIGSLLAAACLTGGMLHAESEDALYLLAGPDAKVLANSDVANYFGNSNGSFGTDGYAGGVVHLGLQVHRWMSVEASFNLGPFQNYQVLTYDSSNHSLAASQYKTAWTVYTYSITPAFTWARRDFVNSLGLRLGWAELGGHVDNVSEGLNGSYDQQANTPDVGILLRTQTIFVEHFSVGMELGYDYTVFRNVNDVNGTGTSAGITGVEHNITGSGHNGSQTALDFSGPHIAIVVGLWTNNPVLPRDHQDRDDATPAPSQSTPQP